jgi:uncharacterized protein (TIGR00369 family)
MSMGPMPFPRPIPFAQTLGFELWSLGGGKAEIRVTVSEGLMNSLSVAHGGLVMTLLDVVMAHAARSLDVVADAGAGGMAGSAVVTIEMKTSFMRPAQGVLCGVGELMHRSATLAFTEGRVFDGTGALCAHATGTFKIVNPQGRLVRPSQAAQAALAVPAVPAAPTDPVSVTP